MRISSWRSRSRSSRAMTARASTAPIGALVVLGVTLAAGPADAGGRDQRGAFVVAESHYGNARVTGAVRPTSLGPQVRLPGGSWIYCRTSCADTLRVETVDFWHVRENNGQRRDGGFLDLNFVRRW